MNERERCPGVFREPVIGNFRCGKCQTVTRIKSYGGDGEFQCECGFCISLTEKNNLGDTICKDCLHYCDIAGSENRTDCTSPNNGIDYVSGKTKRVSCRDKNDVGSCRDHREREGENEP